MVLQLAWRTEFVQWCGGTRARVDDGVGCDDCCIVCIMKDGLKHTTPCQWKPHGPSNGSWASIEMWVSVERRWSRERMRYDGGLYILEVMP